MNTYAQKKKKRETKGKGQKVVECDLCMIILGFSLEEGLSGSRPGSVVLLS
jgi:hypothetical protein